MRGEKKEKWEGDWEEAKDFILPMKIEQRKIKIQNGYKNAAMIPLRTARTCLMIFDIAELLSDKGNKNSITDADVSAIMANSGVKSAILNVKINLGSISDKKYVNNLSKELIDIEKKSDLHTEKILRKILKQI